MSDFGDSFADYYYPPRMKPFWEEGFGSEGWRIVLPHQCDSWEIGSREDAQRLIADLQSLIEGDDPPESKKYEWKPLHETD